MVQQGNGPRLKGRSHTYNLSRSSRPTSWLSCPKACRHQIRKTVAFVLEFAETLVHSSCYVSLRRNTCSLVTSCQSSQKHMFILSCLSLFLTLDQRPPEQRCWPGCMPTLPDSLLRGARSSPKGMRHWRSSTVGMLSEAQAEGTYDMAFDLWVTYVPGTSQFPAMSADRHSVVGSCGFPPCGQAKGLLAHSITPHGFLGVSDGILAVPSPRSHSPALHNVLMLTFCRYLPDRVQPPSGVRWEQSAAMCRLNSQAPPGLAIQGQFLEPNKQTLLVHALGSLPAAGKF